MRKKDLMNFIDLVEAKAVRSVAARHDKIISDAKEKIFVDGGYNRRIENIQRQINSITEEVKNLNLDMHDNTEICYPVCIYDDLLGRLNEFVGKSTIKEKMVCRGNYDRGQIPLLKKAKSQEVGEVKTQYSKVRYVSQQKTSAKEIAEYLEDIGFDISSVRKGDDCVALSVEIDKSKLFVCGENR